MGMTVQRRKDTQTPKVFMHKVADIKGGVSVKSTELGADYMPEGAVISVPENGVCHVLKTAVVTAAVTESEKTIYVKKGSLFTTGDFVLLATGGKASEITAIDKTGTDSDKLTVDEALGAIEAGAVLAQAKAASTDASELAYEPLALAGTGKPVLPNENIDTDAWVIGVTKGNPLPDCVAAKLKGIINY